MNWFKRHYPFWNAQSYLTAIHSREFLEKVAHYNSRQNLCLTVDVKQWCDEHLKGRYRLVDRSGIVGGYFHILYFEFDEDLGIFILRWW